MPIITYKFHMKELKKGSKQYSGFPSKKTSCKLRILCSIYRNACSRSVPKKTNIYKRSLAMEKA
jgi:hypothetical protein